MIAALLVGLVLGAAFPARADSYENEVVEIRRALQSIAHSLEGCKK